MIEGKIISMRRYFVIFAGILLVIALSSFIYLESSTNIAPGWSDAVKIQERGFEPKLAYHNGELWLAFHGFWESKGRSIMTTHSYDGVEWSSPFPLVKESPQDCSRPNIIQWLERPDGTLWFLWSGGTKEEDCPEVLYCAIPLNDTEWSIPQEIHRLGRDYLIHMAENTADGGLALFGERERIGYAMVKGEKVLATLGFECFVQSSDEPSAWTPPFVLSSATRADCIDIFLDMKGVLCAVYTEFGDIDLTLARISEDGVTWGEPIEILDEPAFEGHVLQQGPDKFVFFFTGKFRSIDMMRSSDGLQWGQRSLVFKWDSYPDFDVAKSDDGTFWIVFEGEGGLYIMHYSDQDHYEDIQWMKTNTRRHGFISVGAALFIGAVIVGLRILNDSLHLSERPFFQWLYTHVSKMKRREFSKRERRVIGGIVLVAGTLMLSTAFIFWGTCATRLVLAMFSTLLAILIYLFKEEGKYYWYLIYWIVFSTLMWIIALSQCAE
jgi:hypothetical protein